MSREDTGRTAMPVGCGDSEIREVFGNWENQTLDQTSTVYRTAITRPSALEDALMSLLEL